MVGEKATREEPPACENVRAREGVHGRDAARLVDVERVAKMLMVSLEGLWVDEWSKDEGGEQEVLNGTLRPSAVHMARAEAGLSIGAHR